MEDMEVDPQMEVIARPNEENLIVVSDSDSSTDEEDSSIQIIDLSDRARRSAVGNAQRQLIDDQFVGHSYTERLLSLIHTVQEMSRTSPVRRSNHTSTTTTSEPSVSTASEGTDAIAQPLTRPEAQSQTRPEAQSQTRPEAQSQTRPEAQSQTRPEAQSQTRPEAQSQTRPEAQPDHPKPDTEPVSESIQQTAPAVNPAAQGGGDDEDGETCSICFEPWTMAGKHRLAALRCGHLFGYECINRWLYGGNKCPQCNKKAKRDHIIFLYARKLQAVDNTEEVQLKKSLEDEQRLRRMKEMETAQCRLQLQTIKDENTRLQKEVEELRRLKAQVAFSSSQGAALSLSQRQDSSSGGRYVFSTAVLVSQAGGCRVLSHCERLGCLLASQPSPQATFLPGFGVKKISTANLKPSQYVPIHSKQIRGLAFSQQHDSLLLSAALDNTVKLTSLMANTVVQTYNTGRPVWSCCWCHDNNNYIYAGLCNGSVLVYDTRDTSTFVQELVPLGSKCPVVSLSYIPRAASSSFPCGGLIAGTLDGGCFWEHSEGTVYTPHILPLESGNCTDIQVEPDSRHCLITYRPGRLNPALRCVLMELNRSPHSDNGQPPVCSCSPVQTFTAGSSCKLLTKNAVFKSPAGEASTLVCAGDESTNSTMVWDAGTGALLQKLPADLPVLDICPFEVNQSSYLGSLTEKMLKVYKWE